MNASEPTSADPTSWFDRARFGMFVHWGQSSQQGIELSWPLVGGNPVLPRCTSVPVDQYHASARTFDPSRGSGAPWLYAVVRNAITDGLRRTPNPVAELEDQPGGEPDPSEEAEASWTAWRVHRALEVLPEHERPVVEMGYWRGLSQSEIALQLGIPLGTVKTRTRSALARLADALEGELR